MNRRLFDPATGCALRDAYRRMLAALHGMKAETDDLPTLLAIADVQDELEAKLSRVERQLQRGAA